MNNLQRLDAERDYFVTLNLSERIDDREVIETIPYAHPVITHESVAAQRRWAEISGRRPHPLLRRLLALGLSRGRLLERAAGVRRRPPRRAGRGRAGAGGVSASALYEGWVRHRRVDPVEHEFRYPIFMAYLDLERAAGGARPAARLVGATPGAGLVSALRPPRAGGAAARPTWCASGSRPRPARSPSGPIRMLTNLRYFGHCFNPVTFYFCFDESGSEVEAMLAEVHNTPYGETHAYVLGNDARKRVISGTLQKEFHVSPLMAMDHVYDWRATVPGENLQVHIASHRQQAPQHRHGSAAASQGVLAFDATLSLERRELTPAIARRMLARYPAITAPGDGPNLLAGAAAAAQGRAMVRPPGALDMRPGVALARRVMFAALARIRSGRLELVERGRTFAFGPEALAPTRQDRGPRPARLRLGAARQHRARRVLRRRPLGHRRPGQRSRRIACRNLDAARPPARRRLQPLIGPVQRALELVPRNTRERCREQHLGPLRPRQRPVRGVSGRAADVLGGGLRRPATTTLEEAQLAKLERICAALDLGPDDHLLEIGTGWGGLAIHAAATRGCRVTTTTISREQYGYARERVRRGRPRGPGRGPARATIATSTVCTTSSSRSR